MIAIQKGQMTAKWNYNWMMNVSNNIKNTSSVTVLHYVNPKYLWKFSNCVNQSLDQRFKKENKAQAGELSSKARVSSPVRVCDRHLTGAAGAICVTRTTSCPGPSKSLSPHLIHSACCPSFSLLTGMGTRWPSGTELWMEESFPRGVGAMALWYEGKWAPSNQEGGFINSCVCSLSMTLMPTVPANRFVLAQHISASGGKVFPGFFFFFF